MRSFPAEGAVQGSERGTGASSSSEDQWWLPLSERVPAKNGSASNQVAAEQALSSVVQTAPPQQTVPSEHPRGSSIGLAMLAVLSAAAGAGLTSWWLAGQQRSVALQIEPQTVAVGEVIAPRTPSPSLNDIPLPQPVPKRNGVASTAPAVKDAQRPASARRARSEPTAASPSTEVASASSSPQPCRQRQLSRRLRRRFKHLPHRNHPRPLTRRFFRRPM